MDFCGFDGTVGDDSDMDSCLEQDAMRVVTQKLIHRDVDDPFQFGSEHGHWRGTILSRQGVCEQSEYHSMYKLY